MNVLPAIDLKDGRVVRLYRGEYDTVHSVAKSAVDTAKLFAECGAETIHVVDLDGARDGVRKNAAIVAEICACSPAGVELGGGIRSMVDIDAVFALGVKRAVIGSAAVSDPEFVRSAAKKYGERITVGVDAKVGFVRTHGWTEGTGLGAVEFAASMERLGVRTIIFTDIDTDGMLSGPPIDILIRLRAELSCSITASGGVSSLEDLLRLRGIGMDGAIVGKAWYTGAVDLREAIRLCKQQ